MIMFHITQDLNNPPRSSSVKPKVSTQPFFTSSPRAARKSSTLPGSPNHPRRSAIRHRLENISFMPKDDLEGETELHGNPGKSKKRGRIIGTSSSQKTGGDAQRRLRFQEGPRNCGLSHLRASGLGKKWLLLRILNIPTQFWETEVMDRKENWLRNVI
uniref:Uncharacterized protein n=1 Tax=Solanum lycopersicum TaxID=4081 RepID=A0A3Q7GN51_SOLLC